MCLVFRQAETLKDDKVIIISLEFVVNGSCSSSCNGSIECPITNFQITKYLYFFRQRMLSETFCSSSPSTYHLNNNVNELVYSKHC